ncbi:unnamed protein product [Toxocara canis]|uniref:Uncharacterized protein n=1 Tax=Toxocara canis TaxID=6265 RepID=A0A183U4V8_TOXCA|nr:unnamed protein product [Toxocara canis]
MEVGKEVWSNGHRRRWSTPTCVACAVRRAHTMAPLKRRSHAQWRRHVHSISPIPSLQISDRAEGAEGFV